MLLAQVGLEVPSKWMHRSDIVTIDGATLAMI